MFTDTLSKTRDGFCHVGDDLPAAYQGAPREVLGERALLPCFGDTHLHFASYALFNAGLDVRSARSLPEMCEHIQKFTRENNDKIIMGFGASTHCVEEKRLISKDELDQVCPDRAVFIVKYDGHACILNSKMIAMLPDKVKTLRGWHEETGEMNQEAFFATTDFITKKVSLPRTIRNMLRAVDDMAEKGFGMMHTVSGVGFPLDLDVTMEMILGKGLDSGFQTPALLPDHGSGQGEEEKASPGGGMLCHGPGRLLRQRGCGAAAAVCQQSPKSRNPLPQR